MADGAGNSTRGEFEQSVVERLERIAFALEKTANTARDDFEFRQQLAEKAAQDQQLLVERLTGSVPAPGPAIEGRRARRV